MQPVGMACQTAFHLMSLALARPKGEPPNANAAPRHGLAMKVCSYFFGLFNQPHRRCTIEAGEEGDGRGKAACSREESVRACAAQVHAAEISLGG